MLDHGPRDALEVLDARGQPFGCLPRGMVLRLPQGVGDGPDQIVVGGRHGAEPTRERNRTRPNE